MKTYKNIIHFAIALLAMASTIATAAPSTQELRTAVAASLPGGWELTKFDIELSENLGSATDPQISTRFNGEAVLREALYSNTDDPYPDLNYTKLKLGYPELKLGYTPLFVAKITDPGVRVAIGGLSLSKRSAATWKTGVRIEGRPFGKGMTLERYSQARIFTSKMAATHLIALDTPSHEVFLRDVEKAQARIREETAATQRQIDEERQIILAAMTGHRVKATSPKSRDKTYPVLFDLTVQPDGSVGGTVEWPSDNAIKRVEGQFEADRHNEQVLQLTEVEFLSKDKAHAKTLFGIVYRIKRSDKDASGFDARWRLRSNSDRLTFVDLGTPSN